MSDLKLDLPGVHYITCHAKQSEVKILQERKHILLKCGVKFGEQNPGQMPWLVGEQPFYLDDELLQCLELLGRSIFAFIDAIQQLYVEDEPVVKQHLDLNVHTDLRGLQLDKRIVTFRLYIVLEHGFPKVTEIEEIYGNVGKMHAMQQAYDVQFDALFDQFYRLGISHIYVDDSVKNYLLELKLIQQKLASSYGQDITIAYFSAFPDNFSQVAWRFCYTKDFCQYSQKRRMKIIEADGSFINPLFHGYGTKAMIALAFHPELTSKLVHLLGQESYDIIQNGFAYSLLLEQDPTSSFQEHLLSNYKKYVLKVVDCPNGLHYTWGSRGVFFGDRSATRWRHLVEAAIAQTIPDSASYRDVRYIVSQLIESDRFDIRFLHPYTESIALMPKARIRLGPIFFREGEKVHLVAGHATFVNTSRKVHLGHHAVCCPLDWKRESSQ